MSFQDKMRIAQDALADLYSTSTSIKNNDVELRITPNVDGVVLTKYSDFGLGSSLTLTLAELTAFKIWLNENV